MRAKSIKNTKKLERRNDPKSPGQRSHKLETELERLKLKIGMGFGIKLEWLPGFVRHKNGKQLLEEVVGDTIFIYVEDFFEAKNLLTHGFFEWLLNNHTRPYRQLVNKLITLFEEQQYERKEKTVKALDALLR